LDRDRLALAPFAFAAVRIVVLGAVAPAVIGGFVVVRWTI
jgi:hypothetical protein